MKTLSDLSIGQTAIIAQLHGEGALRRRIMDMGITRGTEVTLLRCAPFGDPLELHLRGYQLSIRREDAKTIEIL